MPNIPLSKNQILAFLKEDVGVGGDATTSKIPSFSNKNIAFEFLSKNKEPFILCGSTIISEVLKVTSKNSKNWSVSFLKKDGDIVNNRDIILKGTATANNFLTSERISLNLMQQLSAVATNVNMLITKLDDPKIKILDTRKTIPGLRILQKYAVKCGGGENHRFGLYDMIMVKDNHISVGGGIKNILDTLIKKNKKKLKIEVECENLSQVKEAILYDIDVIMLDNMPISEIKKASSLIRNYNKNIKIEVSGGITLSNIQKYKGLDIDYISSGSITHSFNSVDISAKVKFN